MAWPANPTNGQQTTINGTTFQYDSANSVWNRVFTSINNNLQYVGQISANAQPNIVYANNLTTLGTLTSLSLASNATVSGANVITANIFTGAHANGNSNVNIPSANGNITLSSAGNANILIVTGTGVNVAGTLNTGTNTANVGNLGVTSNATVGNLLFGTGVVSGTGNVVAGNLVGPHANGNSNVNIPASNGNITFSSAGNANIVIITGTGVNVAGSLNVVGSSIMQQSQEVFVAKTGATGLVAHDYTTGTTFYHTSIAANFTVGLTNFDSTASRATVIVVMLVQGATPYIASNISISTTSTANATTITPKWVNAQAPLGTASRTEAMVFTIFNNGGTYTVLGQLSSFG